MAVTEADLERAVELIASGQLVGLPTETVYGLAADATNEVAVRRIFEAKGRPADHPLIVHVADAEELLRWGRDVPDAALRLAAAFWPGPLTLVVGRGAGVAAACSGGRDTLALRVPDHPVATELLQRCGVPLAAPSANRFGRVSPTSAADVAADLGTAVGIVLDGGPCRVGVESTIVELVAPGFAPLVLRPGGVPVELLEAVLGQSIEVVSQGPSRAPGMLASHYAPGATVCLVEAGELPARCAQEVESGRRVVVLASETDASGLACGGRPDSPDALFVLPPPPDATAYAATLYRRLRDADELGADVLLVVPPPPEGLGLAVLDRLRRSAAPRDGA